MWLGGPHSAVRPYQTRLGAHRLAHPTTYRPVAKASLLCAPASSAPVCSAERALPRDVKAASTPYHVDMVSLVAIAGWILAGLAVAGAIALTLLLSPELRALPASWLEKHLFPDANQITPEMMAKRRDQSKVYRILAFGDSLTEGFTQGGSAFHPYAKCLGDLLYPQLPKDWHLEIEEQGESGERVLFGMPDRLQRTLDEHTTANRLYDWVLLLGGINDLAEDASTANEVMQGLDSLVQNCLSHGANVLFMTVMEVAQPVPSVEDQRQQLNRLIIDYVQQRKWDNGPTAANDGSRAQQQTPGANGPASSNSSRTQRRQKPEVFLYDLASAVPYESMNDEQRFEFWDDGVHLTMQGYEHMGALVTAALIPLVKQEFLRIGTTSAATSTGVGNGADVGGKKMN